MLFKAFEHFYLKLILCGISKCSYFFTKHTSNFEPWINDTKMSSLRLEISHSLSLTLILQNLHAYLNQRWCLNLKSINWLMDFVSLEFSIPMCSGLYHSSYCIHPNITTCPTVLDYWRACSCIYSHSKTWNWFGPSNEVPNTIHTHTHWHIYIYVCIDVFACACVCGNACHFCQMKANLRTELLDYSHVWFDYTSGSLV